MSRIMNSALPHQRQPCHLPSEQSTKSFWHTEPSSLLLGHRSTRELPKTADVVIVGSGITGTSIAHHVLARGHHEQTSPSVVMLEAREACWGATGRNGGHCQPIFFQHPDKPHVGRFELANFNALQTLIINDLIDCEFVAQPGVRAIYSEHDFKVAQDALATIEATAPDLSAMMRLVTTGDELNELRIPTAIGAIVTDVAARLWPYKFVAHILEKLLTSTDLGGTFNLQTLTPVTDIFNEGQCNAIVHTSRGTVSARKVILATNAYTSHLLPSFADLIVPCRGQMSALYPYSSVLGQVRLKTSLGFMGDGLDDYLIQRPTDRGGHLMFGGGRQHEKSIGVTDDSVVDEKTGEYLRRRLPEVLNLPEGGAMKAAAMWSGIMGFSRDDFPWIGPVPDSDGRIFVAAGFTGHGMPNTWLSGKAVASMVLSSLGGQDTKHAIDLAQEQTELPKEYVVTPERMERAMQLEDVESKDWAELNRGGQSKMQNPYCWRTYDD